MCKSLLFFIKNFSNAQNKIKKTDVCDTEVENNKNHDAEVENYCFLKIMFKIKLVKERK